MPEKSQKSKVKSQKVDIFRNHGATEAQKATLLTFTFEF